MNYVAEIREIPQYIIYFKEYFVSEMEDFYHAMSEDNFLQELSDKVLSENPEIDLADPDYNVLLFIDGVFSETNVKIEFCDAVTAFGKDTEEYQFRALPAFLGLNVLHRGPYRTLSAAYAFARRWMEENGYVRDGCPRNRAIDGCWNQDNEDDYLTEVQIPVVKQPTQK